MEYEEALPESDKEYCFKLPLGCTELCL